MAKAKTDLQIVTESEAQAGAGHNAAAVEKAIVDYFKESVEIDLLRRAATKRKGKARQVLKDMGLDTKAIDARYSYYKQKNHARDGYDDAVSITDEALSKASTGDLFAPLYDVENAA